MLNYFFCDCFIFRHESMPRFCLQKPEKIGATIVMAAEMAYPHGRGMKAPRPSVCDTKMKLAHTIVINSAGISDTTNIPLLRRRKRNEVIAHSVTVASTWLAQAK